jgi:hypothetical protein
MELYYGEENGRGVEWGLTGKRGQHSEQGGHFAWPQRGKWAKCCR